jgi:hypothetical protein
MQCTDSLIEYMDCLQGARLNVGHVQTPGSSTSEIETERGYFLLV